MKKIAPELKCGFLSEDWIIDAGAYTASYNIECFHPRFNNLIPEVVAELKKNSIELILGQLIRKKILMINR